MTVELTVTFPDFDDPYAAAHYLNTTLSVLRDQYTGDGMINASFPGLTHQHDDWEWGERCPECGSTDLCIGEITYSSQQATGENFEPGYPLEFPATITSVSCNNDPCMTDLYVSPASYLAEH